MDQYHCLHIQAGVEQYNASDLLLQAPLGVLKVLACI